MSARECVQLFFPCVANVGGFFFWDCSILEILSSFYCNANFQDVQLHGSQTLSSSQFYEYFFSIVQYLMLEENPKTAPFFLFLHTFLFFLACLSVGYFSPLCVKFLHMKCLDVFFFLSLALNAQMSFYLISQDILFAKKFSSNV